MIKADTPGPMTIGYNIQVSSPPFSRVFYLMTCPADTTIFLYRVHKADKDGQPRKVGLDSRHRLPDIAQASRPTSRSFSAPHKRCGCLPGYLRDCDKAWCRQLNILRVSHNNRSV